MGEVLDAGLQLFRATLPQCMPYGALLVVCGQLGNLRDLATGRMPQASGAHDAAWWMGYGVGLAVSLLPWAALLLRQDALARGGKRSMGAELHDALARLPQLLAVTLLCALGVAIGLLLILPGVYLAVAFVLATPVVLLDGRNGLGAVLGALARSVRLVSGHWWRTALMLCLAAAMALALYLVLATLITAAASFSIAGEASGTLIAAVSQLAGIVVGSICAPFCSAMILVIHGDLLRRAESRPETAAPRAAAAAGEPGVECR